MKTKVNTEKVSTKINKIRETKSGELLTELQKGIKALEVKDDMTITVGDEVTVLSLRQMMLMVILIKRVSSNNCEYIN